MLDIRSRMHYLVPMSTYTSTLFKAIADAPTWSNGTDLEFYDSVLAGRIVLEDMSTSDAIAYATRTPAGHKAYWDGIFGAGPEGPTDWDVEDYADENGYTDLEEARAALITELDD